MGKKEQLAKQQIKKMFRMRRKPDESQMHFNQRSAAKLQGWFKNAGLEMVFHRVLRLIFKAAWRERFSVFYFDENPLQ